MKELTKIKYWLFDLDNTLYASTTKVFDQVDKKMSKFISEKLNVSIEEAKKIQKNYFHEYNTTLNGMIKNHKIDADEFLEFVHDIDIDFLKKDFKLAEELKKLTRTEGNILVKLIYRETQESPYRLVRKYRGLGNAIFWQTMAKLYDNNLRQEYDPINNREDMLIEHIIINEKLEGNL